MRRFWPALDIPAVLALALVGLDGMGSRYILNPDGVSYLDLATNFRHGDWSHFVQGYWSPLYPMLLAVVQWLSGLSGWALLPWVHAFDTLVVMLTFGVIWYTARRNNNLIFGLSGLAAAMLASGRLPRIDTVTPDLLLALWLTVIACLLISRRNYKPTTLGIFFGLAFLTKTSSWPWLLILLVFAFMLSKGREQRRWLTRVALACGAVMLCWVIPMSIKAGAPSLGSSGRLNFCWYVEGCDSQMPDTHSGDHAKYSTITLSTGDQVTLATFDEDAWTYQPWGDPTAWDHGIRGGYTYAGKTPWSVRFLNDLSPFFQFWTFHITVALLLPLLLFAWWRGMWRSLWHDEPESLSLMLLGILGMLQFLAIHAEPRLIAPFLLVFALGAVNWLSHHPLPVTEVSEPLKPKGQKKTAALPATEKNVPVRLPRRVWIGVSLGLAWAMLYGWTTVVNGFRMMVTDLPHVARVQQQVAQNVSPEVTTPRILLIGPAGLEMVDAWQVGGRIVAQVIRPSLPILNQWPESKRQELLGLLAPVPADLIWVTLADKSLGMIPRGR